MPALESVAAPTAAPTPVASSGGRRIDYLDATRAFALVLGVVFHASLSFLPVFMGWAVQDISTSAVAGGFFIISHSFRMEVFFLLAGFFSHRTLQRQSTGDFVRHRTVRILVPLLAGWFLLRPLLVSGWMMGGASLRGDVDVVAGLIAGFRSLSALPQGIFTGTHLWFLYYLALLSAAALALRGAVRRLPAGVRLMQAADRHATWIAGAGFGLPFLAAATAVALAFMRIWGVDTPDHTLRPLLPVLALYGGCFFLGWMFSRQPGLIDRFGRLSADRWIWAVIGISGSLILMGTLGLDPGHPQHGMGKAAFIGFYGLMMWSLVALTLGTFRWFCRRPRPWIRYVADSSYWLYLIHLPIVVWLQVAMAEVALHWSLKLSFISLLTLAVSLVTYDLLVRSTFLGQILNGRRRERTLWFQPSGVSTRSRKTSARA